METRPTQSGSDAVPDAVESTASSLLQRARTRDAAAWQRLVDLYGPVIYSWVRQSGLQPEDSADVVQEVFSAASAHIDGFRRDRKGDSFRAWLWTIARNKIRDHFRRRQGRPQAAGGTAAQLHLAQIPEQPPDSAAGTQPSGERKLDGDGVEHRAIELARAGVEQRTWQAFWQVTIEGRAVADVADELDMTPPAVYKAKYRVLRRIRNELDGLIE